MPDPLSNIQAQLISQKSLTAGLAELLRNGPQTGIVLSYQSNGKAVISFSGKSFPLETKGLNLQQGQQVIAKLAGEKILLELVQTKDGNAIPVQSEISKSLTSQLTSMGFTQPNAQFIAEALLKAGIPLDKTVLKELANFLPDVEANKVSVLSFLFDRGLPVNPSMIQYLFQLFSPKPKPAADTNKVLTDLKKAAKELKNEDSIPVSSSAAKKLEEFHQEIENNIMSLSHSSDPDFEEEIRQQFQVALTSAEAQIVTGGSLEKGLAAALLKLLNYLYFLEPYFAQNKFSYTLSSLLKEVSKLNENLTEQSLKNLPSQTTDTPNALFFMIPFWDGNQAKDMEVLYREKRKDRKAGTLDLRMDLTRLGPVRVSMQWEHPNLSVTIHVTDEKIGDYLKTALEELKELLNQKGFHILSIGVHVGEIPDSLRDEIDTEPMLPKTGLNMIG